MPESNQSHRSVGRYLVQLAVVGVFGFAGLVWVLGWLAGLTESTLADAVDADAQTVTIVVAEEPPQLDSSLSTDTSSFMVLGHVMEGLLRYGKDGGLEPGVAERWEIGEDRATFWLRRDARWSDGRPVTAHDFVFGWRRTIDPANGSSYAFILYAIENAEQINLGKLPVETLGVRAVDDFQLDVSLQRPVAYFDKLVAFPSYYPIREDFFASTRGRYGADADTLLYNGPFEISKWIHGARLRLEKNPHYWDKARIRLQAIDAAYFTRDPSTQLNLYREGRAAVASLNVETVETALRKRWPISRFASGAVFYLELNHRPERPTSNLHLRRALSLVIDRDELVYNVIRTAGFVPAPSLFPIWLQGANGPLRNEIPVPPMKVDVDLARHHLELAKRELGVDEIPRLMMLVTDSPTTAKEAEYLQNIFQTRLGLDVAIDKQIFKQRLAKAAAGDFDIVVSGWGPDYDDPLTFGDLFASWNQNNHGKFSNAELDRWVATAQTSLDPGHRVFAFGQIQRILAEEVALIPTYEPGSVYVRHPLLQGVVRRAVGPDPDYTNAYITGES